MTYKRINIVIAHDAEDHEISVADHVSFRLLGRLAPHEQVTREAGRPPDKQRNNLVIESKSRTERDIN